MKIINFFKWSPPPHSILYISCKDQSY